MSQSPSSEETPSSAPVVFLIGLRGSGKSTIGRLVADHLGRPFVDLDDEVLAAFEEETVTEVWDTHGETAWRRGEIDATRAVLRAPAGQIVAMGGGAPMVPGIAGGLAEAAAAGFAIILYLHAPADILRQRLEATPGDRPALTDAGLLNEIETVFARRHPVYESLATAVIDVSNLDQNATADAIIDILA